MARQPKSALSFDYQADDGKTLGALLVNMARRDPQLPHEPKMAPPTQGKKVLVMGLRASPGAWKPRSGVGQGWVNEGCP